MCTGHPLCITLSIRRLEGLYAQVIHFRFLFLNLLPVLASMPDRKNPHAILNIHENERRSFAINLLRAINNSELDYKKKHGTYANWDALLANGYFDQSGTKFVSQDFPTVAHALYGRGPEIVPWLEAAPECFQQRQSPTMRFWRMSPIPKCGYAGVTDDRGLIRQGKSIDCPL